MKTSHHPRRLIIAGGTGFLGRGLIRHLAGQFEEIVVLTRKSAGGEGPVRFVHWDAISPGDWYRELEGAAALVNLVGRTVDCRKTAENKSVILRSRVDSVNALAAAVQSCKTPPPVWIQSATAHIYGDTHDQILDESSPVGAGFAPQVGLAWEAALHAVPGTIRKVILRISFVLGKDGGALRTLARLARFGLGGTVGNGGQYMSWIHEADLHRAIERALTDRAMQGIYVTTAPHPVTNQLFMQELRRAVHRPWAPPAPEPLVRLGALLLRTDPELALLGRRCIPTRLMEEGFLFDYPTLREAISDLIRSGG